MEYAAGKYWCMCMCADACVCVRTSTWWFKWGAWPWQEARTTAAKYNPYEFFYAILCVQGLTSSVWPWLRLWDNGQMKTGFDFFTQQKLVPSFWQGNHDELFHICITEKENKTLLITTSQQCVLSKHRLWAFLQSIREYKLKALLHNKV